MSNSRLGGAQILRYSFFCMYVSVSVVVARVTPLEGHLAHLVTHAAGEVKVAI